MYVWADCSFGQTLADDEPSLIMGAQDDVRNAGVDMVELTYR